jgi:O-antigen/teichoic acid export membrane protein
MVPHGSARTSFNHNISWAVVGNVLYAACQWAVMIVYARFAGAAELGEFTFGVAVTAPVVMLSNMQLRTMQASDARQEFSCQQYLGLRLSASICALGIIAGLALMLPLSAYTALVVIAVGLAKTIESICDVLYGVQQHQDRMRNVAASLILRGVAGLAILIPVVLWTGSAAAGALSLAAAWATVLLLFDLPQAAAIVQRRGDCLRPDWTRSTQLQLLRLAFPLGLASFLNSLQTNVPRYVVRHHLGAADLGVFAAFTYLISVGGTVVSALGQSSLARLSRVYAAGRIAAFLRLVLALAALVSGLSVAGWLTAGLAGEAAIRFLYGAGFEPYVFLLMPIILWAAVQFAASLLSYCAAAARQFRGHASVSLMATLATLVTCTIAVPRVGLRGAVWGGLVGAAMQLLGNAGLVAYALVRDARAKASGSSATLAQAVCTER